MKKTILTLTLCLITLLSVCQNFPAEDVQLLLNKELKVIEKDKSLQQYGYEDFYTNNTLKKKYACCESYNSKYSSLAGKIFKVVSYEPYVDIIGQNKFKLLITNAETGDLYFSYDPRYEHSFPFEVIGGLTLPDDFYCKKVKVTVDKFTNETKYVGGHKNISLIKYVKDNVTEIYLRIKTSGNTLNVGGKGLILLLENNNKIEKPTADIDVTTSSSQYVNYVYTVFVKLTSEDLVLLSNNLITDARLYIYDTNLKDSGKEIQSYLKCLTTK